MEKTYFLLFTLCLFMSSLFAQPVETVNGFSAGANTENNVFVTVGQPFVQQHSQNGYEVSHGVSQAQLVKVLLNDETCQGVGYSNNGFSLDPSTPAGSYQEQKYSLNALYHYDSMTVLVLVVNPSYENKDTLLFYDDISGVYTEGNNDIYLQTDKGCDSIIHRFVIRVPFSCGEDIYDYDKNRYSTVAIAGKCWIKENMKAEHYSDDATAIPMALIYKSDMYPDENENLDIYGRLYSWFSAVKLPEDSKNAPNVVNGYVQGVCPNGWHVPSVDEMKSLQTYTSSQLRTVEYWIVPGTNSSDFSLVPAGTYNASTHRFENLTGKTFLWSATSLSGNTDGFTGYLTNWCNEFMVDTTRSNDGNSVRCVHN